MPGALLLLNQRLLWGAYPGTSSELPPDDPGLVLLTNTELAIRTTPLRQPIEVAAPPVGIVFPDPDAVIYNFAVRRAGEIETVAIVSWAKIGTLPDARLKPGYPTAGQVAFLPGVIELEVQLPLDSYVDVGQGYTIGIRIFDPIDCTIIVASTEVIV